MKLRTALRRLLEGWEQSIGSKWRAALAETTLGWTSKALDREMRPGEYVLPKGAHIFHAFENTVPAHVRAVLLGQDPYPKVDWATGRAFEQGNLEEWPEESHKVAGSLRRIVQAIASAAAGNPHYAAGDRGWRILMRDVRAGRRTLLPPKEFFDHLERQGLLFLNTSLTVSVTPEGNQGHFQLWAPLIGKVLSFLACRGRGHIVFLLFGRQAENAFERSGARAAAQIAGAWETRAGLVRHFHPAAITKNGTPFLEPPNPFLAANELLRRMGADTINWGITPG